MLGDQAVAQSPDVVVQHDGNTFDIRGQGGSKLAVVRLPEVEGSHRALRKGRADPTADVGIADNKNARARNHKLAVAAEALAIKVMLHSGLARRRSASMTNPFKEATMSVTCQQ